MYAKKGDSIKTSDYKLSSSSRGLKIVMKSFQSFRSLGEF